MFVYIGVKFIIYAFILFLNLLFVEELPLFGLDAYNFITINPISCNASINLKLCHMLL